MQPQLLLLLLLLTLSFPVILTRGEAWPEVRECGHIKSQALKGHWREEILSPQMGTTCREG